MICLRCGHCCIRYSVTILKPEKVSDIVDFEDIDNFTFHEGNTPCPHLKFEKRQAVCSIHHYPWYSKLPCYRHSQQEQSNNEECRLGNYILQKFPGKYEEYWNIWKKNEITFEKWMMEWLK